MRLNVSHTTRYTYSQPVAHGLHRLRLKPKATHGQSIIEWRMELTGGERHVEYEDHHHNTTSLISVVPGAQELVIACSGIVETIDAAGVIGQHSGHMPLWCFLRPTRLTRPGPRLRALVAGLAADRQNPLEVLHGLSRAVAEAVRYETGVTDVSSTAEDALAAGRGVCQDQAHVFIAAGRLLEIPTRYVSGYLRLDDSDAHEASHGWAEAHVAGLGWVGFDVANAICPDDRYVRVATGCDYAEAAPVTGLAQGGGQATLGVEVSVEQRPAGQSQEQRQGGQSQRQGSQSQQQKLG